MFLHKNALINTGLKICNTHVTIPDEDFVLFFVQGLAAFYTFLYNFTHAFNYCAFIPEIFTWSLHESN